MSIRTITVFGIGLLLFILLSGQGMAADPPYVKDGAPTEVTLEEDGSNLTLNLYDVFTDDDPEDAELNLSNFEVEGIDISINQTTGDVNITGEEDWNGHTVVVFRAMDGRGYFAEHEITFNVLPINDPPEQWGKISRESWREGEAHHFNVSAFFIDVDGDDLYYYAELEPARYFAISNDDDDHRNPGFDLIPLDPNFYGYIQVVFTAYDKDPTLYPDEALLSVQTAIFEVKGEPDPPEVIEFIPKASTITINETESQVFSVPSTFIYDEDSSSFRWYWYVDDVKAEDTTGESFEFPEEPDYQDDGTYSIRCVVKDNLGTPALTSPTWTLHILDINHLPTVALEVEQMKVPHKDTIILAAVGSDTDGDVLTYRWYRLTENEKAKGIGDGEWFEYKTDLPPGRHYFKCEVSDGKTTADSDWMLVTVEEVEAPGPPGTLSIIALLVASLVLSIASRGRDDHSKAY